MFPDQKFAVPKNHKIDKVPHQDKKSHWHVTGIYKGSFKQIF